MSTVVDQVRPWLIPSSRFAAMTHPHVGAHINNNGTGTPTTHPMMRTRLGPKRSASRPATRLLGAFVRPNVTRKADVASPEAIPNSRSARSGIKERS
ncbi:MAG: hypothetical protein H0U04_14765 [Rubrobacter sp.]|nr:hypothetical protein [Rubrobacter sp.]